MSSTSRIIKPLSRLYHRWMVLCDTVPGWHCRKTTVSEYLGCCSVTSPSISCVLRSWRVSVTAGLKMLSVTSSISSCCMSLLGLGRANSAAAAVAGSGESAMSCSLIGGRVMCIISNSGLDVSSSMSVRRSACGAPVIVSRRCLDAGLQASGASPYWSLLWAVCLAVRTRL
jgi:hypothetical protein